MSCVFVSEMILIIASYKYHCFWSMLLLFPLISNISVQCVHSRTTAFVRFILTYRISFLCLLWKVTVITIYNYFTQFI